MFDRDFNLKILDFGKVNVLRKNVILKGGSTMNKSPSEILDALKSKPLKLTKLTT